MISPFALEPMPSQKSALDIAATAHNCRQELLTAEGIAAAGTGAHAGGNAAAAMAVPASDGRPTAGVMLAAQRVSFQL